MQEQSNGHDSYEALEKHVQEMVDRKYRRRIYFEHIAVLLVLVGLGVLAFLFIQNEEHVHSYLKQFQIVRMIAPVALIVFMAIFLLCLTRRVINLVKVMFWKRASAQLISKKIEIVSGFGYLFYRPMFTYRYSVEGKEFVESNYTINRDVFLFRFLAKRVLSKYDEGSHYKVSYDPRKPDQAFFKNYRGFVDLLKRILSVAVVAHLMNMWFF